MNKKGARKSPFFNTSSFQSYDLLYGCLISCRESAEIDTRWNCHTFAVRSIPCNAVGACSLWFIHQGGDDTPLDVIDGQAGMNGLVEDILNVH